MSVLLQPLVRAVLLDVVRQHLLVHQQLVQVVLHLALLLLPLSYLRVRRVIYFLKQVINHQVMGHFLII